MAELTVRVIEITRGTTHDGPGLRTTLFLKGCPLRCTWCQNPEGISTGLQVWWEPRTCIACHACLDACPTGALSTDETGLHRDEAACTRCGACVTACPSRAMAFTSRDWRVDDLVVEALKDRAYYEAFGGGVTISGGEPLSQYQSVAEVARRLQAQGVHTALDTCGLAPAATLDTVLPHINHVLFDIKLLDANLHQTYTGQPNDTILANLAVVANHMRNRNRKMKLWLRTPLIPDATATPENIIAIGHYIRDHLLDVTERWELCAFNNACKTKYDKLGQSWTYAAASVMHQPEINALKQAALSTGIPPGTLVVSGLVAP